MQQSLGIYIRQLRRQMSLTQTELGGERYSKSYVSAVERGSILPSQDALQFFADQLYQPMDQFEPLLQQAQQIKQSHPFVSSPSVLTGEDDNFHSEIMTLLDLILAGTNPHSHILNRELARFSQEVVLALPLEQQACYAFLQGLAVLENGASGTALASLEFALPLAPVKYQPAILHALGMYHYQLHMFQNSLSYHIRALDLLQIQQANQDNADFLVQVELHCGDDCRELGDYRSASKYYENARRHLQSSHNLKIAAELYQGLGYCTYAAIYQLNPSTNGHASRTSLDAQMQAFKRALSYLLQSRTLYQTCQDPAGEVKTRLLQTMILLDFSSFKQYNALINSQDTGSTGSSFNCESLLEDAEEQCRQMLMGGQDATLFDMESPASQLYRAVAATLSYLVRIHGHRATLARLNGYHDTAVRERSLASAICQEILNASAGQGFTWEILQSVLSPSNFILRSPSLPRLPDAAYFQQFDSFSFSEIHFALGELAEELACSTTNAEYADECILFANRSFQAAVDALHLSSFQERSDPGYAVRCYQRYINILKKRAIMTPELVGDVNAQIFTLLKDGLAFSLHSYPSPIAALS